MTAPERCCALTRTGIADDALSDAGWAAANAHSSTAEAATILAVLEGRERTTRLDARTAAAVATRLASQSRDTELAAARAGDRRRTVAAAGRRRGVSGYIEWPGDRPRTRVQPPPLRHSNTAVGRLIPRIISDDAARRSAHDANLAAAAQDPQQYWRHVTRHIAIHQSGLAARAQTAALLRPGDDQLRAVADSDRNQYLATFELLLSATDANIDSIRAALDSTQFTHATDATRGALYAAINTVAASLKLQWWDRTHPTRYVDRRTVERAAALSTHSPQPVHTLETILTAHRDMTSCALTDGPRSALTLLGGDAATLTDTQLSALWGAAQRTGASVDELADLLVTATPPGTRRHVPSIYRHILGATEGRLDIWTVGRITGDTTDESGMVAAIAGDWGHNWAAGDVIAVLDTDPARANTVYRHLAHRVTAGTDQRLCDAAMRTIGLLNWIERVPAHARTLFGAGTELDCDEWATVWQLLRTGFRGTPDEVIAVARHAS